MLHTGNQRIWPPKTRLAFSLPHDKLYNTMRGRRFDLADQLGRWTERKYITARLAVAVEAKEWTPGPMRRSSGSSATSPTT